jgi:hypothetical protein
MPVEIAWMVRDKMLYVMRFRMRCARRMRRKFCLGVRREITRLLPRAALRNRFRCDHGDRSLKAFTHLGGLRAFIAENHCSQATRRKITKGVAINAA